MNARANLESLFVKPEPKMTHWETELGKKILEGYLVKIGIADARVVSVKDLVVTLRSTASGEAILSAETNLRRKFDKMFELARDAKLLTGAF